MSNIKKVSPSLSMNGFQGHSIGRFPLLMPFTKYKVFDLWKLRDKNPLAHLGHWVTTTSNKALFTYSVCVCVWCLEWVLWQQVMVFIRNVNLYFWERGDKAQRKIFTSKAYFTLKNKTPKCATHGTRAKVRCLSCCFDKNYGIQTICARYHTVRTEFTSI